MEQRQPLRRLGLGRRPLAVALTLAALALVLAACDSDEDAPTPTATPSPTARATMSPHPGGVVITPVPTATPKPAPDEHQQVVVFDLATGRFTPLLPPLEKEGEWYIVRSFHPRFTRDGAHVWIAERDARISRRYDLNGTVVEEIEGVWGVEEHVSGALIYSGYESGPAILVGGVETAFHDTDAQHLATLSPDGRYFARFTEYEEPGATLVVTEVATGQVVATAEEVGFCQCDGGPSLTWSPSSRYLVYGDFGYGWTDGDGGQAGSFALDVESGRQIPITPNAWGLGSDAWVGEGAHVALRDGWAVVLDLATDSVIRRIAPVPDDAGLRVIEPMVMVIERPGRPDETSHMYLLDDGRPLGDWGTIPRPTPFEGGLAFIWYGMGSCGGVSLQHPSLTRLACVPGVAALLSPDGRYLAVQDGPRVTIFEVGTELEETARFVGPTSPLWQSATHLGEWNDQGTHLLIDIGFGLF